VGGAAGGALEFVGNITTNNAGRHRRKDFSTYWNQISPENAASGDRSSRARARHFNWRTLDAIYDYTQQKGILFKEHTFIWGSQQPAAPSARPTSSRG
jgi:endo-1,4-beta-xylanase